MPLESDIVASKTERERDGTKDFRDQVRLHGSDATMKELGKMVTRLFSCTGFGSLVFLPASGLGTELRSQAP